MPTLTTRPDFFQGWCRSFQCREGLSRADSRYHCSRFAVLASLHHSNLVVSGVLACGNAWGSLPHASQVLQAGSGLDEHCSISNSGMMTSMDMAPMNLNTFGHDQEEEKLQKKDYMAFNTSILRSITRGSCRRTGCTTVNVFANHNLLTNVSKTMIIQCNAGVTKTNMVDLPGYLGNVWYFPDGVNSILLFCYEVTSTTESIMCSSS
jgi:hypothetical protein